jgi:hypothetical protein
MVIVDRSRRATMLGIDDRLRRGTTAMDANIELVVFVVIGTHFE